ncbi:cation:proton antiporter [Flexithrix dorotheae]|uniref:cation:proton antiporter n=1 Tax=Flexithrix dorotheae TaxID=70993 RepID=UPI0003606ACC|nr:sodium:proton antiporter [Flexithrix dorotheae]
MELFEIFSTIIVISAIFTFLNQKTLKMPTTINLMIAGLILSVIVQIVGASSPGFYEMVIRHLEVINFSEFLLEILLSFLLFAGALHTDLEKLKASKWPILSFATIGVIISTFLSGAGLYYLLVLFEQPIDFIYCLLFGALISPTDPIAVLGIMKKANAPKSLEIKITGESLFNDGVGVVIFLTILEIARKGMGNVDALDIGQLFAVEVFGGVILGLLLGYIGLKAMKSIDHYKTEVLITLAVVMGGYALASAIHVSGPLAMVMAGLLIGNVGKESAMSKITLDYVNKFWEMIDEILNAILFVLIGLELVLIPFNLYFVIIGLVSMLLLIVGRYISLAFPSYLLGFKKTFEPNSLRIMTWGGLKGGISIALALSLDTGTEKDLILAVTYTVVLLSLIVQGLTFESVIRKWT